MIVIKPPNSFEKEMDKNIPMVFLAGSIEQGTAEMWQNKVIQLLKNQDIIILNPRRDYWDNSWKQNIKNNKFREQVEWELRALECADKILMYFDPKTKSPISLLELGLFAKSGKMIVCCPDGFWRKANVEIVCKKYDILFFKNLKLAVDKLKNDLSYFNLNK